MTVGTSGDDYTGLLVLPAGLILIGVGIATLWRSRKLDDRRVWRYTRRALITVVAPVLAYATIAPLGFGYVITHVMRQTVPAANLGAAHENVSFRTSDGLELQGWYVPSKNGAAVIAFPGRSGSQAHTRMLVRHGYGVLLFDRRGEGKSEGDSNLLGWGGDKDILAAVEFLKARPDVDPGKIGGLGLSVGGELMLQAAAEDRRARRRGLRGRRHAPAQRAAGGIPRVRAGLERTGLPVRDGWNGRLLQHRPTAEPDRRRSQDQAAALRDLGAERRQHRAHEP